jgi:hypothetical protein
MERDAAEPMTLSPDGRGPAGPALALLASLELQPPEGFADRVVAAAGRRDRRRLAMARADELRQWARRGGRGRRRAVASSALLAGAVALGLEARRLRRTREAKAA